MKNIDLLTQSIRKSQPAPAAPETSNIDEMVDKIADKVFEKLMSSATTPSNDGVETDDEQSVADDDTTGG